MSTPAPASKRAIRRKGLRRIGIGAAFFALASALALSGVLPAEAAGALAVPAPVLLLLGGYNLVTGRTEGEARGGVLASVLRIVLGVVFLIAVFLGIALVIGAAAR